MRVLVLGGSGYIGTRLCALLQASGWATPVPAGPRVRQPTQMRLDTRDEAALATALNQVDAVVNCVAGNAQAIADGAAALTRAAMATRLPRLVHLSSMSAYGPREGRINEQTPLDAGLGWYGRAKVQAEAQMAQLAADGCNVTVLRPGCVTGPGSALWVGRIARWLLAGRLGDLGEAGDGWSNLVHLDDVCRAVMASLRAQVHPGQLRAYNLAAPDSPRWNEYFADLGLAVGATPLRRLSLGRLKLDAYVASPPLHVARRLAQRLGGNPQQWPEPITPGLLGLWARQLRLDANAAQAGLGVVWTPYARTLRQSMAWFLEGEELPQPKRLGRDAVEERGLPPSPSGRGSG
jgi:nucleoside-diphosphate-sugar epimerase